MDYQQLYDRLVEIACAGKVLSIYSLAEEFRLDTHCPDQLKQLETVLNDVSLKEYLIGHPLLSAVVVYPEIGYPGQGFFLMARELLYNGFGDVRSYYDFELKRVHSFWRNRPLAKHPSPFQIPQEQEVQLNDR
jgi:hypothetical protein